MTDTHCVHLGLAELARKLLNTAVVTDCSMHIVPVPHWYLQRLQMSLLMTDTHCVHLGLVRGLNNAIISTACIDRSVHCQRPRTSTANEQQHSLRKYVRQAL
jgi:hypothetical protein